MIMKDNIGRFPAHVLGGAAFALALTALTLALIAFGGCKHDQVKSVLPPPKPASGGVVASKQGEREKIEKMVPGKGQEQQAAAPPAGPNPLDERKKVDEANRAKMPPDWPAVVPIIEMSTIKNIGFDPKTSRGTMLLECKQSRENIVDFYKKHFIGLGWVQKPGPPYSSATVIQFSKGDPKKGGSSIVLFITEDAVNHVYTVESTFQIAKEAGK